MADIKQIQVGDTTYNIEPATAYLPLSGGTINAGGSKAPLILKGGASNWNEGLRIVPAGNWSTIMLGGNDIAETEGTSANSWSIHNNNGRFYISKNGSDYASTKLSNTDGTWRVNDNDIIHSGNIGSQNVNYANSAGSADALNSLGRISCLSGTSRYDSGLRMHQVYSNDYPFSYGSSISIENGFGAEIIFNGLGGGGNTGSGEMQFRTHSDWDSSEWGSWRTVIDSSNIGSQNVKYATSAGNADTLDGKHSSDFCLSNSNITNLPINGGIYWNSYVESSSDGSDAASITVIKDGNGTNGTVLQIKQANDNNDIVNVVAGDLRLNGTSVSTSGHTHSSVADIGNSTATTFAYSKSGLNYGDYTWLAGWNGYELRAVNKSQFATAGHTHSNYVTTDTTQTISGKKTFNKIVTANNIYTSNIYTTQGVNTLYIEGPWDHGGREQPTLTFDDGALIAYNWADNGDSLSKSQFYFNFPLGARMNAGSYSMYLNGNSNCYLQSTSTGWKLAKNDDLGSIYADGNNYGRVGNKDHHFFQGFINNIYVNTIYPSSGGVGTTSSYNIGYVGSSSNYFLSGAFKTVYRTSESGLSDIRLKQNISNNDLNALEIINNLNIINFQYDDDIKIEARSKKQRLKAIKTMQELPKTKENKELRKELQKIIATPNNEDMITIGVSAQQLQELLPKKYQKTFIQKESTNQYADQLFIRENRLVYLSFKAIQEQQAIIGSLEEKINLLEEKINALEEKIKKEVN